MQISIDVGYSQVKAMSQNGKRVMFPAVKADITHDPTAGMFTQLGHNVRLRTFNSTQEVLVGEGALRSLNATTTLTREKSAEIHDLFVLTAAYLCGAQGRIDLAVGLPLSYYRFQRQELKNRLQKINAHVKINDGPERYISINNVEVFPQGVGLLLADDLVLAQYGRIAVIDIGYYTTDYLLFELIDGSPVPIPELCGSADTGIHVASRSIANIYQEKTGALAPKFLLNQLISGENVFYKGQELLLNTDLDKVLKRSAELITQDLMAVWGKQADNISQTVLAGGGAILLNKFLDFPNTYIPCDPVYANANGYMTMLASQQAVANH
jgi:plasmid segregation protein ParM